ncbi:MAG: hypothetical protein NVSMB56_12140 [Pyrinomonadaceae bacterium]
MVFATRWIVRQLFVKAYKFPDESSALEILVEINTGEYETMNTNKNRNWQSIALSVGALMLMSAPVAFAQDNMGNSNSSSQQPQTQTQSSTSQSGNASSTDTTTARTRTVSNGEKIKLNGVVVKRDADTFTVRDTTGVDTVVRLNDATQIAERKGNPFRRAKNYGATSILRGLSVDVEGNGDAAGQVVARSVKFSDTEYKVAQSIEARVNPVEGRIGTAENRLGQVEQNAQRLSGQLSELEAVSNAARGGAKAAQETADTAIAGVNTTNERISALDDYTVQNTVTVNFKSGSSRIAPEVKTQLDDLAKQALAAKGYVIEVAGFTDSVGNKELNRRLSTQRADAVVRYLVENHNIPLRRIITPFGYADTQAVADNKTRDGRAQNRRVEVKILVSKGLTQPSPTVTRPTTSSLLP